MKFTLVKILTLTAFISLITAFVCFQAGCFGTKSFTYNDSSPSIDTTKTYVIMPGSKSFTVLYPDEYASLSWDLIEVVDTFEMQVDQSDTTQIHPIFVLDYKPGAPRRPVIFPSSKAPILTDQQNHPAFSIDSLPIKDSVKMKTKLMNTSKSGRIFIPEKKPDTALRKN